MEEDDDGIQTESIVVSSQELPQQHHPLVVETAKDEETGPGSCLQDRGSSTSHDFMCTSSSMEQLKYSRHHCRDSSCASVQSPELLRSPSYYEEDVYKNMLWESDSISTRSGSESTGSSSRSHTSIFGKIRRMIGQTYLPFLPFFPKKRIEEGFRVFRPRRELIASKREEVKPYNMFLNTEKPREKLDRILKEEHVNVIGITGHRYHTRILAKEFQEQIISSLQSYTEIWVILIDCISSEEVRRKIAEQLGIEEGDSMSLMEAICRKRFLLIILGDLQSSHDLQEIGIPYPSMLWEARSKVLLVSPSDREICTEMGNQDIISFQPPFMED